MEANLNDTKPGILRRSVNCWKSISNHKDFVKYTLYTAAGTTAVLGFLKLAPACEVTILLSTLISLKMFFV